MRYRRSVLGPLWLTISTAVLIGAMGPLYGRLFGQDLSAYYPHLAVSFVVWLLLSNLMNESCTAFTLAEGLIKQMKMPLTIHVLRTVWRNLIIFFHHFLIVLAVLVFYPPPLSSALLTVPLAIFAIALNAVWLTFILGTLCARFRDIPPIIQSVVQVLFFLTPVLWRPEILGRHAWAVRLNPLHHMLEIVRAPLLGKGFPLESWLLVILMTLVGFLLGLTLFARYRPRIAYWV